VRDTSRSPLGYRQWLAVFLVVALGTLCLPGIASAAEATTVSIASPIQSTDPGQQFTVSIAVVPSTAIAGMQFDLSFDPSLVTVDSVKEGDLLGQGGASTFFNSGKIDNQAGTVTGVFGAITSPGEAVSTQGAFATITLTARTQGESWPLSLSHVIVGDTGGNPVSVSLGNEGSPSDPENTPAFRWWVLSVIVGVALMLIAATVAGVLFRRRQMVKALEDAGRQDRKV
jgi:hypothetical protein